jgi:thioredoxin reductase (NADPH)
VEEIKGDMMVKTVLLYNRKTDEKTDLSVDGIFIAVGEEPLSKVAQDTGVEV